MAEEYETKGPLQQSSIEEEGKETAADDTGQDGDNKEISAVVEFTVEGIYWYL